MSNIDEHVLLADLACHASALLRPAVSAAALNGPQISAVANEAANRVQLGGKLFSFGAGHAYAFAAELCSRAGGLAYWTSMNLEDLTDRSRPMHEQLRDSAPERDPANGIALAEKYNLGKNDLLAIASQSGRNGASVEMAQWAQRKGIYVVGILSRAHSEAFPSRHPSGLKLADVCDVVIDLCTPVGDAVLFADNGKAVSSTSTISFSLVAQLLNAQIALALFSQGIDVPVLVSANVDRKVG